MKRLRTQTLSEAKAQFARKPREPQRKSRVWERCSTSAVTVITVCWQSIAILIVTTPLLGGSITNGHAETAFVARNESLRADPDGRSGVASGSSVRVVFRAVETAAISAEISARISYLPAREGDRILKGDRIVAFDCRKLNAEHDASVAVHRASRAAYETQMQLMRYRAAGEFSVEQSKFEMEKAEAEARSLEVRSAGCTIYAPFDGRVVEKIAQIHEMPTPNQPLIKIINDSRLELVLMVPSSWLSRISSGTLFPVKVDENGETHEARVLQSTGAIDPISQSARLIAELTQPAPGVMPGMSGSAIFALEETQQEAGK